MVAKNLNALFISERPVLNAFENFLRLALALVSWPKFSVASYRLVRGLERQGISPRTVIDVGANVGQFSVACAKIFPQCFVHAFEPLPDCAAKFAKNCRGLKVRLHRAAVGENDTTVSIRVNSHRHSSSILPLGKRHQEAFPFAREEHAIDVPLVRLDSVLAQEDLQAPVIVKLDVQGYETWALKGASGILGKVDYVLLETSFRPMYEGETGFNDLLLLMKSLGFDFLRPMGWLKDPRTGEILQMDALFERRVRNVEVQSMTKG